jgi:hypothetical protein
MIEQAGMREESKITLPLLRDIFAAFVDNGKKCYSFGENVTINEKLEACKGRCGFK